MEEIQTGAGLCKVSVSTKTSRTQVLMMIKHRNVKKHKSCCLNLCHADQCAALFLCKTGTVFDCTSHVVEIKLNTLFGNGPVLKRGQLYCTAGGTKQIGAVVK